MRAARLSGVRVERMTVAVFTIMGGLAGVSGRHEYKVTIGDWSQNWPGSGNSWFIGDGSGNVTLTVNTNTAMDGWRGTTMRLGTSTA